MQQFRLSALPMILAGVAISSSDASACSRSVRHYSDGEIKQLAAKAVASATAIVDGEVIVPMATGTDLPEGTLPVAYIKVEHTWKGRVEDDIATVALTTYCDVPLEVRGQRVRILLSGVGIFNAEQELNGWAAPSQTDAFNRAVDHILGAPRPKNFTDPGTPPPPESPRQ
jgi:hypothetical protein